MAKRILAISLTIVVLALGVAGVALADDQLSYTALDNKHTRPERENAIIVTGNISNHFVKVAESSSHELYLNESTLGIQVKDKKNNIVYSSSHDEAEGLNKTWENFMYSGVTIEYMNEKQKVTRQPLTLAGANIQLVKTENGFTADVLFEQEEISLTLSVQLEGDRVVVSIPEESIVEGGKIKLQNIYVYPFLGSSKGVDNSGYFFVPDGCGALIRTNQEESLVTSPYIKRMYGKDLGMGDFTVRNQNGMLNDAQQIYMPVYGIIEQPGHRGIAVIVEGGDEYADIEAYISGVSTTYNFITTKFVFREIYKQQVDQNGAVMLANQTTRNQMSIRVSYTFLSGEKADYAGIAEVYQKKLVQEEILKKMDKETDIPLKIEFLAAEKKDKLVGYGTLVMTTAEQMNKILYDLKENGVTRLNTVIRGYSNDGASMSMPSEISLSSKIGSKSEWNTLFDTAKADGNELNLFVDVARGYDGNSGYSQGKDVVQAINKTLISGYYFEKYYYLNPKFVKKELAAQAKEAKDLKATGIAIDNSGFRLYSNWNKNSLLTRTQSKQMLQDIQIEGTKMSYYSPNSYLWKNTSSIYDIPMASSQYLIFTDTVPFMQIVLKGYLPYYAPASNFNADIEIDLLKMIEFGAYPSFYLTQRDSFELYDTASFWLFTSMYDSWKDQIIEEYQILNNVLSKVEGAQILHRTVPAQDIVFVEYTNGVTIAVNYGDKEYSKDNITVGAKDYVIIGAE